MAPRGRRMQCRLPGAPRRDSLSARIYTAYTALYPSDVTLIRSSGLPAPGRVLAQPTTNGVDCVVALEVYQPAPDLLSLTDGLQIDTIGPEESGPLAHIRPHKLRVHEHHCVGVLEMVMIVAPDLVNALLLQPRAQPVIVVVF